MPSPVFRRLVREFTGALSIFVILSPMLVWGLLAGETADVFLDMVVLLAICTVLFALFAVLLTWFLIAIGWESVDSDFEE